MSELMSMLCCWTRPGPVPPEAPASPKRSKKSVKSGDTARFDTAALANDLPELVLLLDSEQSIECADFMHAWADNPRTVGALAATRIAMMAQGQWKSNIREAKGIPKLVSMLRAESTDRIQTAVIALSFLTADCPKNAVATYEAGALPLLLRFMDAPIPGMRAVTSTTLRNICLENARYREAFVQLGGIQLLVAQLSMIDSNNPQFMDVQLEAVLNLQDLIEDSDGMLLADYAMMASHAGAEKALKQLLCTEDKEFNTSVQELLESLEAVQRQEGKLSPQPPLKCVPE